MNESNIIIDIFNKSFIDHPKILSSSHLIIEKQIKIRKIDIQDLSLLETMSDEDLNEIIDKIKINNEDLVNKINSNENIDPELINQLASNFFREINNSIDFVYNLIISKQLGG